MSAARSVDVVVVGGGHAGAEAAWIAACAGAAVALVTLDAATIGVMSCNPAIGGIGKGQMVREIDALGGLMGRAADATGILFKLLNTSKGPAVRSPRAQCDRHAYARWMQRALRTCPGVETIEGAAEEILVAGDRLRGVVVATRDGASLELRCRALVLTTGTFLRGLMHTGGERTAGGRAGEAPASGMSATLERVGFELGRLKTGTPPRLRRSTIEWNALAPQHGDEPPAPFSELTDAGRSGFPALPQLECRITSTTPAIHEAIRANLHRAPMFTGQIEAAGPRYCPSIEDKVVRFADRDAHHVFLEPESHESDWVYCNGIATSLPRDVQREIVAGLPGCERAEIVQWGYAVEYDVVRPHQIHETTMTKRIEGLFLAGQINGTSGYEEAAAQGVVAGINAARLAAGAEPIALGRDEAYIGVLLDDLVTRTPTEPYRMFTSRAEHRLLLRADNAADRLTPHAIAWGTADAERQRRFEARACALETLRTAIDAARVDGEPVALRARRPDYRVADLQRDLGPTARDRDPRVLETVLAERQYAGYIERQHAEIRRQRSVERRRIPSEFAYERIGGLRTEARESLARFRPATLGQAGRLAGVTPADMTLLLVALGR